MYRYVGFNDASDSSSNARFDSKKKAKTREHLLKDCNSPDDIHLGDEGGSLEGWTLQGVLMLIRHGDRGPMSHMRGINHVDCDQDIDPLLAKYRLFVQNLTNLSGSSGLWTKLGPFHGFSLLPQTPRACLLGQLTSKGVAQMLKIGDLIRTAYMHHLGLYLKTSRVNNTDVYSPEEVVVYSTRYRRTFQSAMALMYAFLPSERWHTLQVQESHSYSFCFSDCACQRADALQSTLEKKNSQSMKQHPSINAIVQWIGTTILQNPAPVVHPLDARDAMLALICHNAPLPCRKLLDVTTSEAALFEASDDVINIDDGAGIAGGGIGTDVKIDDEFHSLDDEAPEGCIEQSQVDALMTFTRWQGAKDVLNREHQNLGLLRAYGLIRQLMSYMLRMTSGDKTKFVLYAAHDRTIQNVAAALGLSLDVPFIPYATRMAFEVYKSEQDTEFYFRLVYNGEDITNQIHFCEGGRSLRVSRGIRGNKADLCPIENIIRFIHDDYFQPLNATNFKDACYIQKEIVLSNYF